MPEPYPSRWRFTGQEEEESGLVYMHARYYDPVTGRFISPDTIVPEPGAAKGGAQRAERATMGGCAL